MPGSRPGADRISAEMPPVPAWREIHFESRARLSSSGMCSFCAIGDGTGEAEIVFRDDESIAFLDRRPLFPGHCLLIPRRHFETLSHLPRALIGPFFVNAQMLAGAVEEALEADGSFVAINNKVSQSVAHLHVHVVPRRRKDGLRGFFWPRNPYKDADEMRAVAGLVRAAVARRVVSRSRRHPEAAQE